METFFGITGRTGKQCRERWHNQLDPSIKNTEWTSEEEQILFDSHNKHGNRWATIAKALEGRTDNCVKNHFYSTLRRAFRRLNRFSAENKQRRGLKELKAIMLSKLVAAAEDKFDGKLKLSNDIINKSIELKNRLLPFSKDVDNTSEDQLQIQSLIKEILAFCKSYKRKKTKKSKKDEENDYGCQESSCSSEEQIQKQESHPTLPTPTCRESNEYTNLFSFSASQIINQPQKSYDTNHETSSVKQYQQVQKIVMVNEQEQFPLDIVRRESALSNWSVGFYRIPSFHERLSVMSNQFNFDVLGDYGFSGHKLMHGVDFQYIE